MLNFKLMDEINQILNTSEFQNIDEDDKYAHSKKAISLIQTLLKGNKGNHTFQSEYLEFCGHDRTMGLAVAEYKDDDASILEEILNACDNTVLEQIFNEFGKKTKLGRLIEEKINQRKLVIEEHMDDGLLNKSLKEKSFYELLCEEMDKKNIKSEADFYNKILFSRKLFSKIRCQKDYILSKDNVLWLTAGLGLDYWTTLKLLQSEGYTFRPRSRRDTIITYVIKNGPYTLDDLNAMLYTFGEKTIGEF